jgi:hypothetical protein
VAGDGLRVASSVAAFAACWASSAFDGGEAIFGGGASFSNRLYRRIEDAVVIRGVSIGVLGQFPPKRVG